MMRPKNYKRGFTLVELVIVIAVIAVLAAVLIPTFASVISKANNSADLQLATNLTTAIADAVVDPDETSSAQNIRNHVKDFGYDPEDITTKNKNNVIVYNKDSRKIESLDISKISSDDLVPAYYAEEIIDGYIILSTGGNNLSEALYKLSNLPSTGSPANINLVSAAGIAPIATTADSDIKDHFEDALDSISNADILAMVERIMESTIYVNADGNMYTVTVGSNVTVEKIDKSDIEQITDYTDIPNARLHSRVVFSEGVDSFDIENLMSKRSALQVIIPNSVNVVNSYDGEYEDMPTFAGNIDSEIVTNEKISTIEAIKETIKQGDEAPILYNLNQVYTSDFKGSFAKALEMAEKIHEIKSKEKETIRLVVNSKSTIEENMTIPAYVDVQIPFAIGNNNAKSIMEFDLGDALGGKALGSAYPANDAENLRAEANNPESAMYYLCGEGPGGGYDSQIQKKFPEIAKDQETLELFEASKNLSTADKQSKDYSLTLSKNATLTISGKLTIGAVIGYPNTSGYQGHTSGAYGSITNNGTITVEKGGVLDIWGFIDGSGEVIAEEGGLVFEPFVVTDYLDTLPTIAMYPFVGTGGKFEGFTFNSPFMRYAVMNVREKLTLKYGSALLGRANLMVFGSFLYCRANAPLVTSDNYVYDTINQAYRPKDELINDGYTDNNDGTYSKDGKKIYASGAFMLTKDSSSIVCTYDDELKIAITEGNSESYEYNDIANRNSFGGDIGVTTLTIKGDVTTYGIQMDLLGGAGNVQGVGTILKMLNPVPVDTSRCILPVPYNFAFNVEGNLTIGHNNKYALMPGTSLTIEKTGSITVEEGSALYALDGYDNSKLYQSLNTILTAKSFNADDDGVYKITTFSAAGMTLEFSMVKRFYPSTKLLTNCGFSSSANLTVNGTITVKEGGDLGGTINSATKNATIKLESGAGMGRILNLNGVNPDISKTMTTFKSLFKFDNEIADLLKIYATTYVSCYLRILGADGEDITTDHYNETTVSQSFTLESYTADSIKSELVSGTTTNELTLKAHKAKAAITFMMDNVSQTFGIDDVAVASYSLTDKKVSISDSTITVDTKYNGGWTVANA